MTYSFVSNSPEETRNFAASLVPFLKRGDVITLEGDLGAGKTTFAAGLAKALHIQDDVISPTFNILKCYFKGDIPLYHIDAYRLENQNIEIGLEEFIEGDGICLIEWPRFIEPLIPNKHLSISFSYLENKGRKITISGQEDLVEKIVKVLKEKEK